MRVGGKEKGGELVVRHKGERRKNNNRDVETYVVSKQRG